MDWREGQANWRAGNMDKPKPKAERLRETVERHRTSESSETGSELVLEGQESLSTRVVDNVTGELRDVG